MAAPLKIKSENADDLIIISGLVQDATVLVNDMRWLKKPRQFAIVMNRFRWEDRHKRTIWPWTWFRNPKRVRSALRITDILDIKFQNIPFNQKNHVMALLAITAEMGDDGLVTLSLNFSGFAAIKVQAECLNVFLEDLTEDWVTENVPDHPLNDQ